MVAASVEAGCSRQRRGGRRLLWAGLVTRVSVRVRVRVRPRASLRREYRGACHCCLLRTCQHPHQHDKLGEGPEAHTEIQQVESLAQTLLVFQRAVGGSLLAVRRILLRIWSGASLAAGSYDLRHACIASGRISRAWGIFRVVVIAAARAARRSCVKLPEALSLAAWLRLSIGPRSPALAARAGLVNAATTKDSRPSESPQRQASPAALGKDVFLAAPLPACVATPAPRPTPPVFLHTPASDSPRPHLRHVAGGRKARMGRCPRAPDVS